MADTFSVRINIARRLFTLSPTRACSCCCHWVGVGENIDLQASLGPYSQPEAPTQNASLHGDKPQSDPLIHGTYSVYIAYELLCIHVGLSIRLLI
jgi:hypothetical protein